MEKKKNGNGNGRRWTDDEVEILKKRKHELYGTMSVKKMWKTIAKELNRTWKGVDAKYANLIANGYKNGNGKKQSWTAEEVIDLEEYIRTNTHMEDREEIYNHFPNRTTGSVDNKIKMLKKKKKKDRRGNNTTINWRRRRKKT
mgnify:CR=1 FL=1